MSQLTRQSIFDTAVRGLQSQGWEQCRYNKSQHQGYPSYNDGKGRHCFWGWNDTEIPPGSTGVLTNIWSGSYESTKTNTGAGPVTRQLLEQAKTDPGLLDFVNEGARAHDRGRTPHDMQFYLLLMVDAHQLKVPDDVDLGLGMGMGGYDEDGQPTETYGDPEQHSPHARGIAWL